MYIVDKLTLFFKSCLEDDADIKDRGRSEILGRSFSQLLKQTSYLSKYIHL